MKDADGTYFENIHFGPDTDDALEPIVVSMQLAREASWKKKVVMWTGSRRNCRCPFNNPNYPYGFCTAIGQKNCIPQSCEGFVQTNGVEPTALLEKDFQIALAEFLMVVEKWSYGYFAGECWIKHSLLIVCMPIQTSHNTLSLLSIHSGA